MKSYRIVAQEKAIGWYVDNQFIRVTVDEGFTHIYQQVGQR